MAITSSEEATNIEDALESTGFGKFTIFLILTCGFCLFGVNTEIYSIGYILPAAECDLNLDTASKSLITSATLAGTILTTNLWGFLSDRYSRRKSLIYGGLATFVCSFVSAASPSVWPYVIFKFFCGLFISAPGSVAFVYVGEFLSPKYRSRSIIFCGLIAALAFIYSAVLSWILLPLISFNLFGFNVSVWRVFSLLNALPIFISCSLIIFLPESPKFLLCKGKHDEALDVLRVIHKSNSKKEFTIKRIFSDEKVTEDGDDADEKFSAVNVLKEQIKPLFQNSYILKTFSTCFIQFINFVISSGLFLWYSEILKRISLSEEKSVTICDALNHRGVKENSTTASCVATMDESIFKQNLFIGLLYVTGYTCIILSLRVFRKSYLITFIYSVCCALTVWVTYTNSGTVIDVLFIIILVFPGVCVPVLNALVVDLFPTQFRATALSFEMITGRIGSVVASSVIGYLLQFNCVATFLLFSGLMLSCALVSFILSKKDTK